MIWAAGVFAFILGAVIGSFLNVLIYRIPRDQSVVFPPSACGACGARLGWRDLFPVVSYVLLRGRCRNCGAAISPRYPLVEVLSGLGFLAIYLKYGLTVGGLAAAVLFSLLLAIIFIDLDFLIIPNRLVLAGLILGVPLVMLQSFELLLSGLLGLAVGGGLLLLTAVVSRGGMGGGDIKLAAMIGLYLGWPQILLMLFISFLLGAIVGLGLVALRRKKMKEAVPFGPFIAVATYIVMFWGPSILNWYTNTSLWG
ncbi:MAG: prepilin peptidase [Bacillota bacterium]